MNKTKTDRYQLFLNELRLLASALERHPKGKVLSFSISPPASDDDIKALEPLFDENDEPLEHDFDLDPKPFPDQLKANARIADGAVLKWQFTGPGRKKSLGILRVPSLRWLQESKNLSYMDGEPGWSLVPGLKYVDFVLPCDGSPILALAGGTGYLMAEDVALADIWTAMLDGLGIPGWDLRFDEHQATAGMEDIDGVLAGCQEMAAKIRTELGLPVSGASNEGAR